MAEKKTVQTKTVTRVTSNGTRVTVSEETAAKLGGNFTTDTKTSTKSS